MDPKVMTPTGYQKPVPGYHDDDQILLCVQHAGELDPVQIDDIERFVAETLKQAAPRQGRSAPVGMARPMRTRLRKHALRRPMYLSSEDDAVDPRTVQVELSREPISFAVRQEQLTFSVLACHVLIPNRLEQRSGAAIPVVNILNRRLAEPAAIGDVVIQGASPDWIVGSTGDVIIKGGPGTRPTPAPTGSWTRAQFRGQETVYKQWSIEHQDGEGVTVVVLDTIPNPQILAEARSDERNNELLRALEQPGLQIEDVGSHVPSSGHRLQDYGELEMADHGLFVAGIIRLLAPRASIRLIQVLNDHGVGDLRALLAGLARAARLKQEGPLVVNCSLTLAVPPGLESALTGVWGRYLLPLDVSCSLLNSDSSGPSRTVLVGAAGNDSPISAVEPHRRPGYPAALPGVVGVASVGPDGTTIARFSNRADTDLIAAELGQAGIATFGGLEEPEQGMLSVFSAGTFPDERNTPNKNGWAYWSGTSFAAPVVAGIAANGLSAGLDAQTVLRGIALASRPPSTLAPDTVVGEVLGISQG